MPDFIPSLPQNASDPAGRTAQIGRLRDQYTYDYQWPPGVAMPAVLQPDDHWTPEYLAKAVEVNLALVANGAVSTAVNVDHTIHQDFISEFTAKIGLHNLTEKLWDAADFLHRRTSPSWLASMAAYAQHFGTFEIPLLVPWVRDHPSDVDLAFAWQRVGGVNPMVLRATTERLDHFPVTEEIFRRVFPGTDSLAAARAEGRLFVADYAVLNGAQNGSTEGRQKYMTAPLVLYVVDTKTRALLPVAIQCTQTPDPSSPIFTPADGWRWRMAQTFAQVADANHHEAISHLGQTHLVMGAVTLAMRRQVAAEHPLRVLVEPHVDLTFAINDNARKSLVSKGGTVDKIMGGTIEATLGAVKAGIEAFILQDVSPLVALHERGVLDGDRLRSFPYREDAIPVWKAIENFVGKYVVLYYHADADVEGDTELRAWLDELGRDDGGRLRNLRPVHTIPQLIELMASILFTASAQHAAVNFAQYPYMGYIPNMPGAAWAPAPGPDTDDTEEAWLARLPPLDMTVLATDTVWQLCNIRVNYLGKYSPQVFLDPRVSPLVSRFNDELSEVESGIDDRDRQRMLSYPYLRPSLIPASIHI